jgi:uncharacterized protein (DUF488 family)
MTLFTLGHGTTEAQTLAGRLRAAGIERVVDVRRFPGSRRWPWFGAAEMARWLPEHGIAYVPAPELGGRREPRPDSPHVVLRERGFRGYADYMETAPFRVAFARLLSEAATATTAILCSETLWWRCHRRLIADATVLLGGVPVVHLVGEGQQPHRLTEGVRRVGEELRYDGGEPSLFDDAGG